MATAAEPVAYAGTMEPGASVAVPEAGEPTLFPLGGAYPVQQGMKVSVRAILGELPSARSETVEFGALRHPELRLSRPIHLEVSVQDESVVVTWAEADEFGYGDSMGDALEDFARTLPELYFRLHEPGVRLNSDLDRVRRVLDEYIEHRHA